MAACLGALGASLDWAAVVQMASPWVQAVRDHPPAFWALETLLQEYPISSAEGLALMRLAESLLRVPDADTAIALLADQLGKAAFAPSEPSEGTDAKALARLFSVAVAMGKHGLPGSAGDGAAGWFGSLGARAVVAATVRALQLLGHQFVLGQTLPDAMHAADAARRPQSLRFSFDMLGEGARTDADALRYLQSYSSAIDFLAHHANRTGTVAGNDGISIKLSALHPRYEDAQRARVLRELVPRVWGLCEQAARANIPLTVDAEEADRLELSLAVFEALALRVAQYHPGWCGLGMALQAYQTRALELTAHVVALARKYGIKLMCRLVKGAYWDTEIKRAQEMGVPHYPVFTHKHHTDIAYLACAQVLLQAPDAMYAQFATHNAATIAAIVRMVASSGAPCELQRLHGMGAGVYREVLKNTALPCRVYAPVGAHRDLLAYLVRRLLENGANASFVHQLTDEAIGVPELLASPLTLAPRSRLPLPPALWGEHAGARRNSTGLDLTVASMRAPLVAALQKMQVPAVPLFDPSRIPCAFAHAAQSHQTWCLVDVAQRASVLRRASNALLERMPELCALLVKEAFKTWVDAVSEVREAVDFLRYYADEAERVLQPVACPQVYGARDGHSASDGDGEGHGDYGSALLGLTGETNTLRLTSRGVWVCISPWNFPLAVFVGQVGAALVTGNTVLAKPAEQTPGIAQVAVQLLHAAGVPAHALQLLHGPGETVGAALVAQPGVAGVVFTGSTPVAKSIQRALAASDGPIIPFIAETGGINAMVVDSSALPEQVVDAVITSAFRSAGQRCSALRLLCVHEAIADRVIQMLQGAIQELAVGDPALFSTDVGPVIDAPAYDNLQQHLTRLRATATALTPERGVAQTTGSAMDRLVAPQVFAVHRVSDVQVEIFGPVLQVVRWSADPAVMIAHINALGYGLTLGIQTRIDSRAQALARAAHVGNVYINRNMVGAVVGAQPFGGEGLSGTGPKAGGPHYLYRFCSEQTLTVNMVAAGGNAALLAMLQRDGVLPHQKE